jgi:hypothetical protein
MEDDEMEPQDFPRVGIASALPGAVDKFVMTQHNGKYYMPLNTPPERHQQWLACTELVDGYVEKCRNSKLGKRAHLKTDEILVGYYRAAVEAHRDVDKKQLQWVFRRVAAKLNWEAPDQAMLDQF